MKRILPWLLTLVSSFSDEFPGFPQLAHSHVLLEHPSAVPTHRPKRAISAPSVLEKAVQSEGRSALTTPLLPWGLAHKLVESGF